MTEIIRFTFEDKHLYQQALEIRRKVFIEGQDVPENLEVEHEDQAIYYLFLLDGIAVGTGRWRKTDKGIKLERFAVLPGYRNKNLGTRMLQKVLADLENRKEEIYLHSQLPALNYYLRQGFEKQGPEFVEAGIRHFFMVYKKRK